MTRRVALLIPAFQPAPDIVRIVEEVLASGKHVISKVVIVDDGSDAAFSRDFAMLAAMPNVTVLRNAVNLGKGAALKHGFNHLLVTGDEVSIITADADGQHTPADIVRVAEMAAGKPGTQVMGVRHFGQNVPLRSKIGNVLTRAVMHLLTGVKLEDTQTGLRAWPRQMAADALRIPINGYDFEMEALVRGSQSGCHPIEIIQIPIATIYLNGNRSSHFSPLLDSMRIYFVFMRFCGAGLVTMLVDNIVFLAAFSFSHNIAISQVMSRTSGGAVSFWMSRHIVFRSHVKWGTALIKFFTLVIVLGVISYAMIRLLSSSEIGLSVFSSKLLTELLLFLASFAIQRDLVFRK